MPAAAAGRRRPGELATSAQILDAQNRIQQRFQALNDLVRQAAHGDTSTDENSAQQIQSVVSHLHYRNHQRRKGKKRHFMDGKRGARTRLGADYTAAVDQLQLDNLAQEVVQPELYCAVFGPGRYSTHRPSSSTPSTPSTTASNHYPSGRRRGHLVQRLRRAETCPAGNSFTTISACAPGTIADTSAGDAGRTLSPSVDNNKKGGSRGVDHVGGGHRPGCWRPCLAWSPCRWAPTSAVHSSAHGSLIVETDAGRVPLAQTAQYAYSGGRRRAHR